MKRVFWGMSENRHIRRKIARERQSMRVVFRLSLQHVLIMCVAFLALMIQALVVQTHFHNSWASVLSGTRNFKTLEGVAAANGNILPIQQTAPRSKNPVNEDSPNCPLCQAIAQAGQFVPSSAALAVTTATGNDRVLILNDALPPILALSHIWQGRGPPKV